MLTKLSVKPCSKCRSWADCNGRGWYSIQEIRFCRFQVRWVIEGFLRVWADEIIVMRDTWPSDPGIETGYTDAPQTQHAINCHAPYERSLQIVGEIRARISRTRGDGRELVLMLENHADQLSTGARNALSYCSGWRRKKTDYSTWLRVRDWRNDTKNVST